MLSASKVATTYKGLATTRSSMYTASCQLSTSYAVNNASSAVIYDEGEYLHESVSNSYIFQNSLPRLPVPKLESSCKRYLDSMAPLVSSEDPSVLDNYQKVVNDFEKGQGVELQDLLAKEVAQNQNTSYISKPWFDMYLKGRDSLVINNNPYIGINFDPKDSEGVGRNHYINRLSNLIHASLRMKKTLDAEKLKPEVFHMNAEKTDTDSFYKVANWIPNRIVAYYGIARAAYPLDMSQFKNLFSSTRIPKQGQDCLQKFHDSRHIVVQWRNRFYEFDVVHSNGKIATIDEIRANVKSITNDTVQEDTHSIGVLTSMNRDEWARARDHLLELDASNRQNLERIDSAVFVVSIDDTPTKGTDEQMSRGMLYGEKAGNRWFDKSFSLLCRKSGECAVNFEHAWGDGVAVLRYVNEIYDHANGQQYNTDLEAIPTLSQPAKPLGFKLDDTLKNTIDKAQADFDRATQTLNFSMNREVGPFGRQDLKKYKIGADSLCQFAFQLGYYRLFNKCVATYESANTAAFKHGRTETIRPATHQTLAATKAFLDPNVSLEEKHALLRAVDKKHNQLVKQALMGQGFDRHLFKLKHIAETNNLPLHDLYTNKGLYARMNHNILSTSTLQSPSIAAGGFGPVVKDGYGLGYSIFANTLGLHITSYTPHGADLVESIGKSMYDIQDALEAGLKK